MSKLDIIEEIKNLPKPEQQELFDMLSELLEDKNSDSIVATIDWNEEDRKMAIAAELMLNDYLRDPELTIFTALDGEDFYNNS